MGVYIFCAEHEELFDSIPCAEITDISKLDNDLKTLSALQNATGADRRNLPSSPGDRLSFYEKNVSNKLKRGTSLHMGRHLDDNKKESASMHFGGIQLHGKSHKQFATQSLLDQALDASVARDIAMESGQMPIGFHNEAAHNFEYIRGSMHGFTIKTLPTGYNSGRVFVFSADSAAECDR